MHPECRRITHFMPDNFLIREITCHMNIPDIACLQKNLLAFVAWKEEMHRWHLSKEMIKMFPHIPATIISQIITQLPLHINAHYAICTAITSPQGFTCPEYKIERLEDQDLQDRYDAHIPDVDLIPDPDASDLDLIDWHTVVEDAMNEVETDEDTDCGSEEFDQPARASAVTNIRNVINMVACNMDPRPSTSKESNGDLGAIGPHVPQVVEVNDVIEQIIDIPNRNEPQPSTSNSSKRNQFTTGDNHVIVVKYTDAGNLNAKKRRSEHSESDCPVVKMRLIAETMEPSNASNPIVIPDDTNTTVDQKLLNTLAELFPDCEREHLAHRCRGKQFHEAYVDQIAEDLFTNDYPRKVKEEAIDFDGQLDIMMNVLPDADPEYLSTELAKIKDNDVLKLFMSQALELRNYPKREDVEKKKKMCAQARQYTTDFNPEEFLRTIPDPETYFKAETFRAGIINKHIAQYDYMNYFLRNHFTRISVRKIAKVLATSATLLDAIAVLERCQRPEDGAIGTKRKRLERGSTNDIPLLQLFAYIENKPWILRTMEVLRIEAEKRKQEAIANKEVNTCGCCFDDEVMPEDTFQCPTGCLTCRECIKRSAEILFAENNLQFPCLASCGEHIALDILQACVSPKIFCKIAKRKQLEEVRAAGIDDLEICPFCDFAAIPAVEDKVFKCFNPECMKETCRMCKEPSHIPLRCEEVEKDKDVKQRVFIENQMTEALMRQCWRCNLKFIKSDGCNKISCKCGATMCYVCNQSSVDYNHFNGLGGNEFKKCPLYSNTDLLHEENAINGGRLAKEQLGVSSLKVDPLADAEKRIIKAKEGYKKRQGEQ